MAQPNLSGHESFSRAQSGFLDSVDENEEEKPVRCTYTLWSSACTPDYFLFCGRTTALLHPLLRVANLAARPQFV
jgi:hypothetical protein